MNKWKKVEEVMTKEVMTVGPYNCMDEVQRVFEQEAFHHLPVVEDGKVVGILSKTDYLRLLHGFTLFKTSKSDAYNKAVMQSLLVKEVMTASVVKVKKGDSLGYAAEIFRENYFHALPVVDETGAIEGIITTYDLLMDAYSSN